MSGQPWDASYEHGPAPWDIGGPQPAVLELAAQGVFTGSVLDAGCGTGDDALHLAARGLAVLGFDVSGAAVAIAAGNTRRRGLAGRGHAPVAPGQRGGVAPKRQPVLHTATMRLRPDVLVLGGGGVLAGIEDAAGVDLRDCEAFVGTSAGALVAAHLAAGRPPRRPASPSREREASEPAEAIEVVAGDAVASPRAGAVGALSAVAGGAIRQAGGLALGAGATFVPLALGVAAPGGAWLRSLLLRGLPQPATTLRALQEQVAADGASFDGRLRIAAVARDSGRRIMFGSPRAPRASVGAAVAASCAVPWLFSPVTIAGRDYVDGGVWSPTNLDAAPVGRGTHVLCLSPTASLPTHHALLAAVHGVARSAAALETLAVRRRGARVITIAPSAESAAAMGTDFMASQPQVSVLAAGYRQGLALATADA